MKMLIIVINFYIFLQIFSSYIFKSIGL